MKTELAPSKSTHLGKRPCGFTLIELVVVIIILAILAALIVMRLGGVDTNAKLAASCANLTAATRTVDIFKTVSKGKIPDRFDSLLEADGTLYNGNGDPLVNSGVWSGWLSISPITAGELGSLRRVSSNVIPPGGPANSLITVFDHDPTVADPNLSTVNGTARTLATGANCAFVDPATGQGTTIYRWLGEDPADTSFRFLAVGLGSNCSLVGGNKFDVAVAEAPLADDPSPNSQVAYRRVILLFRVSAQGAYFAEYAGAVTSYGKNVATVRSFMTN